MVSTSGSRRRTPLQARPWLRAFLADHPHRLDDGCAAHVIGSRADHEFVEDHAEGIDIGADIDGLGIAARLLGRHIGQRSLDHPDLGEHGCRLDIGIGHPRQPEIENLDPRQTRNRGVRCSRGGFGVIGDEDVGRFEIAMDHPALVGVVNRLTDGLKEAQSQAEFGFGHRRRPTG